MYSYGVAGEGTKEFFYEMEEIVVDSLVPIETEHLEKILLGYS